MQSEDSAQTCSTMQNLKRAHASARRQNVTSDVLESMRAAHRELRRLHRQRAIEMHRHGTELTILKQEARADALAREAAHAVIAERFYEMAERNDSATSYEKAENSARRLHNLLADTIGCKTGQAPSVAVRVLTDVSKRGSC